MMPQTAQNRIPHYETHVRLTSDDHRRLMGLVERSGLSVSAQLKQLVREEHRRIFGEGGEVNRT